MDTIQKTLGGVSDLHLQLQEDFAADFLTGQIDEQQFRVRLSSLGYRDYEIDETVEAVAEEKRERFRTTVVVVVIAVALMLAAAVFASPLRGVGL